MIATARELLAAFDALPLPERQQAAAEIMRRAISSDDLPEAALHQLADELFRSYDAEEAAHADPSPR